jgi:anti-sigma factor RsiW
MNVDLGIELQAYLDGELNERDAARVAKLIETDAEARGLFTELQQTSAMLKANEPEMRLPESREFFWSKIEREIARTEAVPVVASGGSWFSFVRRHFAALSGATVAAALVMFAVVQMNVVSPSLLEEIDNPLEDTGSFAFRSESQQLTLVWISNPADASADSAEVMPMPEADVQ